MAKKHSWTFDTWYAEQLGDRWPDLREALAKERQFHELADGLTRSYFLDEGSYMAAKAVGVEPGDKILDMCAAPGGKTLSLALDLSGHGHLVANDRSSARRLRLKHVLDSHLPAQTRALVDVTGHDARKWGLYEQNSYDRVLLDAPCSSERHVLSAPDHLARWSPARTKQLAMQAHAMLVAAHDAVIPGGMVLYATCALSPLENDGVVQKLLKKRKMLVAAIEMPWGESTDYGWQIWPDTAGGRGPIYLSRLVKPD